MASDRVKATTKKKVLSKTLDLARCAIEKTERQDLGATYDVLDNIEVANYVKTGLKKKATQATPRTVPTSPRTVQISPTQATPRTVQISPTQATPRTVQISPTQATPRTVQLRPTQVPKKKIVEKVIQGGSKVAAVGKFLAKKAPPVTAAIMAYEAASLANSEEAREKAREQHRVMGERGLTLKGAAQNIAQGLLDPMGTLYARGDALVDIRKAQAKHIMRYFNGDESKYRSVRAKLAAQRLASRSQRGIKR
jgi:hypothetical protein